MSWAGTRPRPLRTGELTTLDTLGRSRPMTVRTWAWLIGMSGEPDARLVDRAKSFANPPALELRGARVGFDGYVPERRAIQLVAEGPEVIITIKPAVPCVNPVFEFEGVPDGEARVVLAGRPLDPSRLRMGWADALDRGHDRRADRAASGFRREEMIPKIMESRTTNEETTIRSTRNGPAPEVPLTGAQRPSGTDAQDQDVNHVPISVAVKRVGRLTGPTGSRQAAS